MKFKTEFRLQLYSGMGMYACLDLPGFTTAMDGGSAGAAGSGSSKNLEGLHTVTHILEMSAEAWER